MKRIPCAGKKRPAGGRSEDLVELHALQDADPDAYTQAIQKFPLRGEFDIEAFRELFDGFRAESAVVLEGEVDIS